MGTLAGIPCYMRVKMGRQAPAEAAESVQMFREESVGTWNGPTRAEITGKRTVRTEKGIAKNQSSVLGDSTPRNEWQCLDLGTVCLRARVEHVRDWNGDADFGGKAVVFSESASLCLC